MSEHIELYDLPKDHLSTTSRRMYLRCGRQFWYRYVEGQKIPPDSSLVLGVAAHGSLAFGFADQCRTDRHLPVAKLLAHFAARLPVTLREMQELAGADVERKAGDTDAQLKDDGVAMLKLCDGQIGAKIQPERVEAEGSLQITAGQAGTFKLVVKVDLRTRAGVIIDYKTTKKRKPEGEALWDTQLTAEQLVEERAKRPAKRLEMHVIGRQKRGPFLQVLQSPIRTAEQKQDVLQSFAEVATAIRAGIFPKTDQIQQTCSWCGFRKLCRPEYARWQAKQKADKAEEE